MEDAGVDESIILKCTLKKWDKRELTEFGLGWRQVVADYEHGNVPSDSINVGNFFD